MCPKMIKHGPAVVRDKYASFTGGAIQNFGVAEIIQIGILGRSNVDRRFTLSKGLDDSKLKIVVRLEANTQGRRSLYAASAFAR